jgi:hypothetical protein
VILTILTVYVFYGVVGRPSGGHCQEAGWVVLIMFAFDTLLALIALLNTPECFIG